jgi:hypothetical protein
VRLRLSADGAERLARLSALHLEELRRFAPHLEALWDGLDAGQPNAQTPRRTP